MVVNLFTILKDLLMDTVQKHTSLDVGSFTIWFNEHKAAAIIGCSVSKLRQDRHKCKGLPYTKFGRSVRYSAIDIYAYMDQQRIVPLQ